MQPTGVSEGASAGELLRALRDVVACTTLPAMWAGRDPEHVARGLIEVLVTMLRLEFAGVRLVGDDGRIEVEDRHPRREDVPARIALDDVVAGLGDAERGTVALPHVVAEELRVLRAAIGVNHGVAFVGSTRPDFPTPNEALVIEVAVNQAAVALDGARLLRDLRARDRLKDQLIAEAQMARMEAEAANRAKDDFLAVLSHELRTPLTAMLGWVQLLQTIELEPGQVRHGLAIIERNTRMQTQLVDDLLDASRIVAGTLDVGRHPVDVGPVVRDAVETFAAAATAKQVHLDVVVPADGATVLGDPPRLQQIVANLVSNAIKFVAAGGHIRVAVEHDERAALVRIVVSDDGAGIDPESLPHIFDRFRQENGTTTRVHGGLGLGLAIVRHLVAVHGGTVTAASPGKDRGATFTVELPAVARADDTPADREPPPTDRAPLRGLRVLLVEDHDDSRDLIAVLLGYAGALPLVAASVDEAIETLERLPVDIVLTDLSMPGRDGFALLEHVRGRVPAVALTAFAGPEARQKSIAAGFAGYLAKPVELVDLVATLRAVVRPAS